MSSFFGVVKFVKNPVVILVLLIACLYWQFFLFGKIPFPGDMLVGAYFPWLDYKWGYAVGVPVKNPSISDVFSQFFLWKYLAIDIIKGGNWPLWNPYSFSGTPLLATYHSATLFPFNILLFMPKYFGWGLFIFGQTLFAALGMYLLLNSYIKHPAAKLAGSFVFSLSGLMTTWLEFGTAVWGAATYPFMLFALESYWSTKKTRYLFLLSALVLVLILAGHPQVTTYGLLIFGCYLLFKFLTKKINVKQVLIPVFFCLLGLSLAAVQILPAADFINESIRNSEKFTAQFNYGLVPPVEAIKIIIPDFFGSPVTYNQWSGGVYYEYGSFLGTLSLPLLLPLFFRRFRGKTETFWLCLFMASLFLTFENPLSFWLYSQPWSYLTYSFASRAFFITSLAAAILIGFSIDKLVYIKEYFYWVRKANLIVLAAIIGIITGLLINIYLLRGNINLNEWIKNLTVSLRNSILPLSLLTAVFIFTQFNIHKKWVVYFIVALLFFDLGRYFIKFNTFVSPHLIFPTTLILDFLKKEPGLFRIGRVDAEIVPPNTWITYGISSIEGYDPMILENSARFFNKVNNRGYASGVSRYVELSEYPSLFLNALNTKYLLAVKRDEKGVIPGNYLNYKVAKTNYTPVFEDKNSVVLRNPDALERAYFAKKLTTVPTKEKLIQKIDNPEFDPTKEAVIVDEFTPLEITNNGNIKIHDYSPNKISLSTNTENEAFLVLANTFEKGWKLYENNKKAKLYEVNGALQGIKVPKGENFFELKYYPDSFDLGLKITLLSLALFLTANLYSIKKRIW